MTTIDLGMPGAGTLGVPHLHEDAPAQSKKDFASDHGGPLVRGLR